MWMKVIEKAVMRDGGAICLAYRFVDAFCRKVFDNRLVPHIARSALAARHTGGKQEKKCEEISQ